MNFKTQNAKNLISKDSLLSQKTAQEIVDTCDIETFETLCENSEHIFDFIKEKIIKNLSLAVNSNNIKNTFEFAKIYNELGDFILESWYKSACDDLGDKLLEILDNGTAEQKIYAVRYFQKINDPLAIDYLKQFVLSSNDELAAQSAKALGIFNDNETREQMLNKLGGSQDYFEKFNIIKFLINYGKIEDTRSIIPHLANNPLGANIACEILYKFERERLLKILETQEIDSLYDEIISSYPEDISLETIYDFDFSNFINSLLKRQDDSYPHRILCDLKYIFTLINDENIYTFDLNKDTVAEIKKITGILNNFPPCQEITAQELKETAPRILKALTTLLREENCECADNIINLINETDDITIICKCAETAKKFNFIDKLNKTEILKKISDPNVKALCESYFS